MGKIISTLVTVVIAVAASAGIWIGANLVFNQVRYKWARFNGLVFGVVGFLVGVLLSGNRVTRGSEGGFVEWVWLPVVLAVGFGVGGVLLTRTDDARLRLITSSAVGVALGLAIGVAVQPAYHPEIDFVGLVIWTAVGLLVGGGIATLRKGSLRNGLLLGGAAGWTLGAWGTADIGGGSIAESIIACVVPAALIGVRLGFSSNPELTARTIIDQKSRAAIFLVPAVLFIIVTLVVPALRTIYLSLLDRTSSEWVGLQNYTNTFTDRTSFDGSGWANFFTSQLFYIGVVLLFIGIIVSVRQKAQTGRAVEFGGPSMAPLIIAGLLLAFALFTALRGTIINNLWWVVGVTFGSTALGLAIAVLADNAKGEKIAKSIIFMPMAISLVGASIIWRFMYRTQDTSLEQTGVMNAFWVGLGRLSTGSGIPTIIIGAIAGLVLIGLLVIMSRSLVRRNYAAAAAPGVVALLVGWFFVRYWGIIGGGVGGFRLSADGSASPRTIDFVTESPYNNWWLMFILIWIQTGFAMVILSAAIKAVPEEFVEAARVDGATTSQIFWRITLPQIATTIGVVVTTLIVLVMKVFDIVKVVTNGQFGTQVLANDMFNQAFAFGDTGRGAALAVLILLSVLPVMYLNIRRMQKEA